MWLALAFGGRSEGNGDRAVGSRRYALAASVRLRKILGVRSDERHGINPHAGAAVVYQRYSLAIASSAHRLIAKTKARWR